MSRLSCSFAVAAAALWLLPGQAALAAPRVLLELATQEGFQATDAQVWYQTLTRLGVSGLQIRGMRAGDAPRVETTGSGASAGYRVTGILTARNELILPGGRFSSRDGDGIKAWLDDLRENGPPGAGRPQKVFGLDPRVVGEIRKDLAAEVNFETAGLRRTELLAKIARELNLDLTVAPGTGEALQRAGAVREELKGVAAGTALAYILRPAGFALVPRPAAGGYQLHVMAARDAEEIWPVGLPAEDKRRQVLPVLSEVIEVEIEKGTQLTAALSAIQGRLKVPFLADHNALAAEGIDITSATVQLPARKLNYSIILRTLLGQARLVYEVRTDEAGAPFIWITTLRRRQASQPRP